MTVEEFYVLNMALDGKDIFGFPSFRELDMSKIMIQGIKKKLIRGELLESESSLTMKGIQIVQLLEHFKKAKKYVKLGSLLFGICDSETAIALIRFGLPQEFMFQHMKLDDGFSQLCSIYPFLAFKANVFSETSTLEIGYEELEEAYKLTTDNAIYLSTYFVEDKKTTDEVVFLAEGLLFMYDRKAGLLTESINGIENVIKERMALR